MSLDSLISVTITAETAAPAEANFGTPMFAAYHTAWVNRVREYTDPAEMLTDGFTVRSAAYQAAKKAWSQQPHPDSFKIGRRANVPQQTLHLTPINTTEGFEYSFSVFDAQLAEHEIEGVVAASDDVEAICDTLTPLLQGVAAVKTGTNTETFDMAGGQTLVMKIDNAILIVAFEDADFGTPASATAAEVIAVINAAAGYTLADESTGAVRLTSPTLGGPLSTIVVTGGTAASILGFNTTKVTGTGVRGLNCTDVTTHLVLAPAVDGEIYGLDMKSLDPLADMSYADMTADPGLEADLNAIYAEDPEWYGMGLDSNSPAEVSAAAQWIESKKRIGAFDCSDSDVVDSTVEDDLFSDMQSLSIARSYMQYSLRRTNQWGALSLMTRMFTQTPGKATWAHQTIRNVVADGTSLRTTYKTTILNKGGNYFRTVARLNLTFQGRSPVGEWLDTTRFIDFIHSRLQTDVLAVLANNEAIPYTDTGAQLLGGTVRSRLMQNVSSENEKLGFANEPMPFVNIGRVADQPTNDRANRHFSDIDFGGRLSGAIHTLDIAGKVTV